MPFSTNTVAQGRLIQVEVDLLAGEYEGTGPRHRTQKFDDVLARKVRGADLAFESFTEVELQGELPEGGKDQALGQLLQNLAFFS